MKRKESRLWLWIVLAAVVAVAGLVFGRQLMERQSQASEPEPGQVAEAFVGDLSAMASASGRMLPQREATLALGMPGRVEVVHVRVGDAVKEGDLLVELESDALLRAARSAEVALVIQEANLAELKKGPSEEDIAAAEAAVASAQAQLEDLLEGASEEEIAATEANLRAAEASVWAASEQRDQVAAGPSTAEIAAAEAQLVQAELQYKMALEAHDASMRCVTLYCVTVSWEGGSQEICSSSALVEIPDDLGDGLPFTVSPVEERETCPALGPIEEQARYNLEAAAKSLESAQAALDRLRGGADVNQLGAANANVSAVAAQRDAAEAQLALLEMGSTEAQVAAVRAQVAQAQASLAALQDAVSDERLAIAEAQVEQARIALEEALDNLSKASLHAPFDGVVTVVYVQVGEYANGPAVELVDFGSLEVVLDMDEVDIGVVAVGQPAVITLESWPDRELSGQVVSIAPRATAMMEIVTYQVHLSVDATDMPLRAGMTANAELVTAQRQNVLLVPNRAITADRSTGRFTVRRMMGEAIDTVEVSIGLRDNLYTEVLSGLDEGDRVVIGDVREELDFSHGPPEAVRNVNR